MRMADANWYEVVDTTDVELERALKNDVFESSGWHDSTIQPCGTVLLSTFVGSVIIELFLLPLSYVVLRLE